MDMVKFKVGKAGNSGAGQIGKVYFDSPQIFETNDPEQIEIMRRTNICQEIKDEQSQPPEIQAELVKDDITTKELKAMEKLRNDMASVPEPIPDKQASITTDMTLEKMDWDELKNLGRIYGVTDRSREGLIDKIQKAKR